MTMKRSGEEFKTLDEAEIVRKTLKKWKRIIYD